MKRHGGGNEMLHNRTRFVILIWLLAHIGISASILLLALTRVNLFLEGVYFTIGALGAQFFVVSIWMVLSNVRYRLLFGVAFSIALYAVYCLELHVMLLFEHGNLRFDDCFGVLLLGPITLLAWQIPLAAVRSYNGWQIVTTDAEQMQPIRFGINNVLIGTTLVAVSLVSTQAGARLLEFPEGSVVSVFIFAAICCLLSVLSLRTCHAALADELKFARLALSLLPLTILVSVPTIVMIVMAALYGGTPVVGAWSVCMLLLGYLAATTGTCLSFRWAGWRLETRNQPIARRTMGESLVADSEAVAVEI